MTDRTDPILDDAIARLTVEDRRAALLAKEALDQITAGEPLTAVTQYALQEYVWVRLPGDWPGPTADRLDIASALGRALELAGLPRYAELCRSAETTEVLRAYEGAERAGLTAAHRASERSGVEPPDLDDFRWGMAMGIDEAEARWSSAAALEIAIAAGELRPGTRGWRDVQRRLVAQHLDIPRPELGGRTYRNAILTERVERWVAGRGAVRRRLLEPVANLVLAPVAVPADALESVGRLRWLLMRIGDGVTLTPSGRLPRAIAAEATATRLGALQLTELRALAERSGAVRQVDGALALTKAGRQMLDSTPALWRAAAQGLASGRDLRAATAELALAVLIARWRVPLVELEAVLADALADDGWRRAYPGGRMETGDVADALWTLLNAAGPLGVVRLPADPGKIVALTGPGRAAALEALRARATRPAGARAR